MASDDDQGGGGRGGLDVVMGILFLVIGVVMLLIPATEDRKVMMLVLALVNIAVGVIKLARGLRG